MDYLYYFVLFSLTIAVIVVYFFQSLFLFLLRYIFKTQFQIDLDVRSYWSKTISVSCPQLGLNIKIEHFGLSSKWFNSKYNSLIALKLSDIRLEGDIVAAVKCLQKVVKKRRRQLNSGPNGPGEGEDGGDNGGGLAPTSLLSAFLTRKLVSLVRGLVLPLFAILSSKLSSNFQVSLHNTSLMQLGLSSDSATRLNDCLLHSTIQLIQIAFSTKYNGQLLFQVDGFSVKVFKSSSSSSSTTTASHHHQHEAEHPTAGDKTCLAQMSFPFHFNYLIEEKSIDMVIQDLEIIIYDLLQLLSLLPSGTGRQKRAQQQNQAESASSATEKYKVLEQFLLLFPSLLQRQLLCDISFRLSCLSIKLVREFGKKELTLGVQPIELRLRKLDSSRLDTRLLIENFRIQDSEAIIDFALAKCAASGKIELNSVSERLQFLLALEITSSSLSINNAMIHSWFTYFLHLVKNVKRSSKQHQQQQCISDDLITTATSSDGLDQPASLHQIIARHITKLSVQLDINDTSLTMKHLEGEGEAMNVKMVTYGLKHLHTLCVHNLDEYFKETSIEFVVETLWCWNGNKNVRPSNPNSLKKYNEKHVPLFMSNLILKFGNMNSSDLRINCVMDGLQVSAEYFLSQLESFDFDFFSSGGGGGGGGGVPFPTVKSPKTSEAAAGYNSVLAQINFTSVNLFTSQLMVRIDSTAIDLNGRKLSCSTNGFAINSMYAPSATLACLKASELTQHRIVYFSVMRINFSQEADKVNREISLSLTEEIYLQWSPSFHQTVEDLREDLSRITAKMMLSLGRGGSGGGGGEEKLATSAAADSAQTTKFSGFNLSLKLDGKINLGILLSNEGDTMRFETEYFVLSLQNMRHISSKCELLSIYFNDVQSCCVEQLLIRHLTEAKNPVDRKIFKLMEQERNSAIEVTIHKVSLNFPYQFDFAYYFNEKFMSIVKWLRLSYSKEGRLARYLKEESPSSSSTAMAADFILKIGHILIEVGDDPFEVRLSDNYILMEDEYKESQLRWAIARQKIEENIKKPFSALSESKVAELRASFDRQTADTYMKRSKRLYETGAAAGATRTALFTAKAEELTLHLAADTSYNTYEKMVAILRAIDQASPYPEDLRFSTIWCRQIVLALGKVLVSLRDFPQPMLNAREINLRGILLGAEQEASARARRTCLIDMGPAFERVAIERSMTTLKFYHDISSKVGSLIYTHGACWEPILQQVNLSFEKIFRPSTDPSPTLPWWDKMRFLFHGALHVVSDQIAIVFHASLDPYNSTELIEISFLGAAVQLLTGKIVAGADLEVLVHTASKYDECRIVHLPDINVAFLLNWGCSGNRYDHHSVMPCARDKLPEYTCNQVHDSYRAFRSHHLNLSASIETKEGRQTQQTSAEGGDEQQQQQPPPASPPLPLPEEKTPSVLLYNSTLRWLENKMFMITGFPRLTRRGKLYNNVRPRKMPFTRLFKSIRLTIYLQRLDVSYWSSYSKSRGFRISSCNLTHSAEHRQTFVKINDGLVHRPKPSWELIYMNSELSSVEITLYKVDAAAASTGPGAGGGGEREDEAARFFFLKLHKVSYNRETKVPPHVAAAMALEEEEQAPIHRLIVHDLKGAWTKDNRDIVLTLFDSYFKTQLLKRNLSTEALRLFKDQLGGGGGGGGSPSKPGGQFEKNSSPYGGGHHQQHSSHHLSKGNAANMLQKLIAEVESESNVADTEQIENGVGSDRPMLYGIEACCQTHDLLLNNWLIELINSQVVLRGCETDGYVIVSAAKTSVTQRIHRPVWKNRVLYSKTTWQGSLECMQYYATVDAGGLRIDDITWLNLDDIEEQGGEEEEEVASGRKNIVENPDTVMGSGRSVGGVVNSEAGGCSTTASSAAGNGSLPGGANEPPSVVVKVPIQMQRIVSRCRCQFFYASYGENTDPSCYEEVPPLPADDLLPLEPWDKEVAVDTFTLTHEHLEISTNSQQFAMIMDLVNNLLLYVPHKKEVFEKQQRIRFSMQLNSLEDQRGPISELQDKVRLLLTRIKALEKEDYYMRKNHHGGGGSGSSAGVGGGGSTGNSGGTIGGGGGGKKPSSSKLSSMMTASDDPESAKLAASLKETEWELHQCKEELARVGDDLSIMINCYKEAQLIASKTKERQVAAQESRDLLAQVVRRNEVCFKQASWRLTDIDGQLMLCDMVLQNFLYTKVSKNDDSVQHSFELGYVSVKNQMPNQVYREVLQPTELQPNMPVDQHRALRIICIEKAPVGGISVKEHLEVNVIPLTVGLTYAFFMKMLKFFFPERSTSLQEQQQQQQVSSTVTSTTGVGSSSAGNAPSAFGSSTVGSMAGDSGFDSLSGVGADDTISSAGSISTITSVSSSSKGEKAGKKGKGASAAAAMKKEESTLSLASSLSSYNFKSSSSKSNPTTSFQHIEKMRERASKNQTFVFIKIPEVPIRISYKGNKNKNLEDLRDVNLILPTFEYHNRTWTWLDLLMALKNDSKRVLLSQALKHKFHISKSKPQQLLSSALLSSSSSSSSSASAAAADAEKQQQQQQSALQQGSNSGGSGNGGSQSVVKSSEDEDKVRILLGKIVVPQKTTKSKSLLLFGKK